MYSKGNQDGFHSLLSTARTASAALALAAASCAVALTGAQTVHTVLTSARQVSVDMSPLTWWSHVYMKLGAPTSVDLGAGPVDLAALNFLQAIPNLHAAAPKVAPKAIVRVHRSVAQSQVAAKHVTKRLVHRIVNDRIEREAAAPKIKAAISEAEALRNIHFLLHRQFIAVVSNQASLNTQIARVDVKPAHTRAIKRGHFRRMSSHARASTQRLVEKASPAQPSRPQLAITQGASSVQVVSVRPAISQNPGQTGTSSGVNSLGDAQSSGSHATSDGTLAGVGDPKVMGRSIRSQAERPAELGSTPAQRANTAEPAAAAGMTTQSGATADQSVVMGDYSIAGVWAKQIISGATGMTTQPGATRPSPLYSAARSQFVARQEIHLGGGASNLKGGDSGPSNANPAPQPTPGPHQPSFKPALHVACASPRMKYSVIEAFQPATELGSATRKVYSYEGTADGCQGAWMLSSADSHLPTLAWRPGSTVQREIKVPLISNNNATLLAALSSAPLQPETGIVFGRVPAGWTVELSGRAERPVFLDDGLHLVPAHVMTSTRYFAFLNAEPGAQLVQLVREDSSDGAVAVPVLNGTATYVDLTHFSKRDFSGIVLDASQADFEGLPNVTVHVVGETFAAAYTDPSGGFTLHDVMVFDDEPFYVETNTRNGYTHRYRISPDASNMREGLRLFRFGDGQLDAYTRQLEGGVSPDSGIAIGALPHLAGIVGLKPEVTPVLGNTTLIPETYTIGDADHLLVDAPMSRTVPRFFAVQLPEGPQIASVKDHGGNTLWSELFVASPAVVNVLSDF